MSWILNFSTIKSYPILSNHQIQHQFYFEQYKKSFLHWVKILWSLNVVTLDVKLQQWENWFLNHFPKYVLISKKIQHNIEKRKFNLFWIDPYLLPDDRRCIFTPNSKIGYLAKKSEWLNWSYTWEPPFKRNQKTFLSLNISNKKL